MTQPIYELSQEFMFEAAHTLARNVPLVEYQPSKRIHGHTYTASVVVRGTKGVNGMLEFFRLPKNKRQSIDLFYLRAALNEVREKLDHHFLDEVEGLGPATLENLCEFIHRSLADRFPIARVSVSRASGDACTLIARSEP